MKATVAVLFFAIAVACLEVTSANPLSQDSAGEDLKNSPYDEVPVESHPEGIAIHHRQKRLTCDIGSFQIAGISLGHSVCAVHCVGLFRGFRGGYCNKKAICVCRK